MDFNDSPEEAAFRAEVRAFLDQHARPRTSSSESAYDGAEDPVAFTSKYSSWTYAEPPALPQTDRVLAGLLDMRVPLTFSVEDCALIAAIIRDEVSVVFQGSAD